MLFDLYVPTNGWLQRLDPRTKIALVLSGALLFVVFDSVIALLALLAAVHVILLTSRVPAAQIVWVWRQLRRVLVIIVVVFPFFSRLPGLMLFELGPLTVTWTGMLAGVTTATRVVGMSLLFFVILFTTRQNELVRGLVRLGLPFEWGLTLAIALRYIPTFTHAVGQIQQAQAARGWQVERGDLRGRLRGVAPVLVALIIEVLHTGDTLGMALAARGVGAGQPRTVWRDIHFSRGDWLALALIVVLLAGLLYARFALGIGADLVGSPSLPGLIS
jgi:energy-coupling factor transport system permease protein